MAAFSACMHSSLIWAAGVIHWRNKKEFGAKLMKDSYLQEDIPLRHPHSWDYTETSKTVQKEEDHWILEEVAVKTNKCRCILW